VSRLSLTTLEMTKFRNRDRPFDRKRVATRVARVDAAHFAIAPWTPRGDPVIGAIDRRSDRSRRSRAARSPPICFRRLPPELSEFPLAVGKAGGVGMGGRLRK